MTSKISSEILDGELLNMGTFGGRPVCHFMSLTTYRGPEPKACSPIRIVNTVKLGEINDKSCRVILIVNIVMSAGFLPIVSTTFIQKKVPEIAN